MSFKVSNVSLLNKVGEHEYESFLEVTIDDQPYLIHRKHGHEIEIAGWDGDIDAVKRQTYESMKASMMWAIEQALFDGVTYE